MINKISFKNYKLFKEKQTLEIKPITILIGKNNSGKSAVLKLMTLIEGALNGKSDNAFSLDNDGVVSGKEFKDLVYGKFGRALEIEVFQENQVEQKEESLKVKVAVDISKNIPIIESWILKERDRSNNYKELINLQRLNDNSFFNEIDETEYLCSFEGIYLSNYFYKERSDSSGTVYIQPFFLNTDFIGAIREKAKLDYRLNPINEKSSIDGKFLYDFIIRDYLTTDKIYFNKISDWISEKFEGWNLYIDVDSEPYHIELRKGKLEIDITETGMGIAQSLPLITRAFKKCEKETLIIIEEPESHLHPYAYSQLAQLFAESIQNDKNKKYLIETHSQNFVLRLRRIVAEGDFKASDLGIYYVDFDEDNNESIISEIVVDEGGGVDWWPNGIFGETNIETKAIYKAQINDLKNVDRNK